MLFKPELRAKIILNEKTQTRRPQKDGEQLVSINGKLTVMSAKNRVKMQVSKTYSVQYGYGKPTAWWNDTNAWEVPYDKYETYGVGYIEHIGCKPLKIKIVDIWQEHVAEISHGDSVMEGFQNPFEFWQVWCGFYDTTALKYINGIEYPVLKLGEIRDYLQTRPTRLYRAFAYDFEVA